MSIECLSMGIFFADIACEPISHLPKAGELVPTDRVSLHMGGCAANVAVDLAKLGVEVGVSGCVGDDPFGDFIARSLDVEHIDVAGVHRIEGAHSASTMMVNVEGEDRRFISTPGANTKFHVDHVPAAWFEQAKVIYIGGYLVMPTLEDERLVEMLAKARAAGARVVLDIVLFGGRDYWDALRMILPQTDVFLPNDDEAALVTGLVDPVEQAEKFREAGARTVVITSGDEGAVLVSEEHRLKAGVYPVEFVGGAGSGDAFDAGFIAGVLRGEDDRGCLRWGSALGASSVRGISTTGSVFSLEEAKAFMKENKLSIRKL